LINGSVFAAIASLLGACGMVDKGGQPDVDVGGEYSSVVTNRYARALGYMDAGDDSRAQREFEAFGEAYPDYSGAHVNLGIIYDRNGRPDAAEAAFRRAVSVCAECASAYNHLGITQRHKGLFDEAEQSYLRAIEANPDYTLAYYNLGVLYDLYRGRPDLALQYYEEYVERAPEAADAVRKWIIDLRRRVDKPQRAAQSGVAR
jgi:Tfp pilus assembly protein PilF